MPKFKQFDWLISKLISLSPNQNASKIREICFLQNQLTDDSALTVVSWKFIPGETILKMTSMMLQAL